MTPEPRFDHVLQAVGQAYGSFQQPRFDFVQRACDAQPWAALIDRLSQSFSVTETTDINADVSAWFAVSKGRQTWSLAISMVGPYALVLRYLEDRLEEVLVGSDFYDGDDKEIAKAVDEAGFQLLQPSLLEERVPLRLANSSVSPTLYQALISDGEAPWHLPADLQDLDG
jgi:hypothetical protein